MELNLEEIEKAEGSPFVERFEEFYNAEYKKQIERIVEAYPQEKSLVVDYKALEKFDPILADELLDNPDAVIEAATTAIQNIHIPTLTTELFQPNVRFSNMPKDREINIKDISAKHLNKMICVEGVLRQQSKQQKRIQSVIHKSAARLQRKLPSSSRFLTYVWYNLNPRVRVPYVNHMIFV